jgi:hypothetical protein
MIHIVEEMKLLLLLGNCLKHIRGNVRYLVTWNVKEFTVGYFLRLDKRTTYRTRVTVMKQSPNSEYKDSPGIWMIHIVEEIKLLLLLGNRVKHIRGNVRYLVTCNIKEFTVGYSTK